VDSQTFSDIRAKLIAVMSDRIQVRFGEFSNAIEARIASLRPEEFGFEPRGPAKIVSRYGVAAYQLLKDPAGYYDLIRACRDVLPRLFAATVTLNGSFIEYLIEEGCDVTTATLREKIKHFDPGRVISFSQIDTRFADYIKREHPKYTIIFVHFSHMLDKAIMPMFRAMAFDALPRAICVTLNPNLENVESEEEEHEYVANMQYAEQVIQAVLADSSFNQTQGVLQCTDVDGVITTAPLEVNSPTTAEQARRLVLRAFAQLEVDNRRQRLSNFSGAISDLVDEVDCYFKDSAEENAILIWQANIQIESLLQAIATKAAGSVDSNREGQVDFPATSQDYSIPDLPRDIIIAIQQLSSSLGMFVLTFESVQKMLEYYELNNRMRQISDPESQIMFDQFLSRVALNPAMFSNKMFTLISEVLKAHARFANARAPKGLITTLIAVIRGVLQAMGRVILRRTATFAGTVAGGVIVGITSNAASQGLSGDPLYQTIVAFFQNARHMLLALADKFPEYFGYVRGLMDLL